MGGRGGRKKNMDWKRKKKEGEGKKKRTKEKKNQKPLDKSRENQKPKRKHTGTGSWMVGVQSSSFTYLTKKGVNSPVA